MTVGDRTYKGLAVPLFGESELKQDTAATDFVTLTGDSSITGDFLVCRAGETEKFWINSAGKAYSEGGVTIAASKYLKFSAPITTAVPTTALTKGDVFLCMQSTTPQLGVCVSAAGNTLRYFTSSTATFGRASTT